MPYYYMDYWYLVLVLPTILLALFAQFKVKSTFNMYSNLLTKSKMTAHETARKILDENGLFNVSIERVSGNLTDHFDPKTNVIRLSDSVYNSTSAAAIGVAAHEAGHAVQYAQNYAPIKMRNAIIPITNIGATVSPVLIILGIAMSSPNLVMLGIVLYSTIALFQLITLPVEFNASRRAVAIISATGAFDDEEIRAVKKVLSAAALTYVAALLTTIANLLRFILISRGNNRK